MKWTSSSGETNTLKTVVPPLLALREWSAKKRVRNKLPGNCCEGNGVWMECCCRCFQAPVRSVGREGHASWRTLNNGAVKRSVVKEQTCLCLLHTTESPPVTMLGVGTHSSSVDTKCDNPVQNLSCSVVTSSTWR